MSERFQNFKLRRKKRKDRFGINRLYFFLIFILLIINTLISAGVLYLLKNVGLLENVGFNKYESASLLLLIIVISVGIGAILSALSGYFVVRPFNQVIEQMNRLANGDYKARLTFSPRLREHAFFKKLSESFNTMANELDQTEILREDFINNFSHEFKTPIVSIAGFAKLLRKANLTDSEREEYLAIIEEESLRLATMATNTLNLTKVENQTILTDVSTFNVSEQIRSCILLLEPKWQKKNILFELEFNEFNVTGNEELLKHVWINLLDNAIKFSPENATVEVDIAYSDSGLNVVILNTGDEIPPEQKLRIFSKFYQADESHSAEGNGIGLALADKIVRLHHGTISVSCKNGVTAFSVFLPDPGRN